MSWTRCGANMYVALVNVQWTGSIMEHTSQGQYLLRVLIQWVLVARSLQALGFMFSTEERPPVFASFIADT